MSILVTGATGYLGRHICRRLFLEKRRFGILARHGSNVSWFRSRNIAVHRGDITRLESLDGFVRKPATLIHCAGAADVSDPKTNYRVNVQGTRNLISILERVPGSSLIFVSSHCAGRKLRDAYGESKRLAEELVSSSFVPSVILRPTMIYGPGSAEWELFVRIVSHLPVVPIPGGGDNLLQPVFYHDAVNIILSILDRFETCSGKIFPVAGPTPVSGKELVHIVSEVLGLKRLVIPLPGNIALAAARFFGTMKRHVPVSVDQVMGFLQDSTADIRPTVETLGITLLPLKEGVRTLLGSKRQSKGVDGVFRSEKNIGLPEYLPRRKPVILSQSPEETREGHPLCWFESGEKVVPIVSDKDGTRILGFDIDKEIEWLRNESYYPNNRPLYTRFPLHPHVLPGQARFFILKMLARKHRYERFPDWPVDTTVELLRLIGGDDLSFPWPGDRRFCISLTHDLDAKSGFSCFEKIARIEEAVGLRSTWFITGSLMDDHTSELERLHAAGHEIALHGYNHDNHLAWLPPRKIRERLKRCEHLFDRWNIQGFRSPCLSVSEKLFEELERYFLYDSSVPNSYAPNPAGRGRGCCSVFPFWKGSLLEIPATVPLEDMLLSEGKSPGEIRETWLSVIKTIRSLGGVAVITLHSEPHLGGKSSLLSMYGDFTQQLVDTMNDAWFSPLGGVAGKFPL